MKLFKQILLLIGLQTIVCLSVSAQGNVEVLAPKLIDPRAKTGTYQIISDGKQSIVFTEEHLIIFEEKRHDTEEVILYFGYSTTVIVLPRNVIEKEDFVPILEW